MSGPRYLPGNVGGAWLIDSAVHRSTGPWTAAVHALLEHLHGRVRGIPHVIGFDDDGREVLSYLPGRVIDVDRERLTTEQLVSVVEWTRHFHDAVRDFTHPGPWRAPPPSNATLIGHNDIAPYNAAFDGDQLVGIFDWDFAGPTTVEMELAFIAWNCVPLWSDDDDAAMAERLSVMASTYGAVTPDAILSAVPERIQPMLDWIPQAAAAGDDGMRRLMTRGEPEQTQRALDRLMLRMPSIERLL
jgi:hypothetical protein